jgi:hypothetical protein
LGSIAGPGTASAQQTTSFEFSPIGGSRVTGHALVTADGQGTNISVRLAGLGGNAPSQATLNVGSCAQSSAELWVLNLQWVDERSSGDGSGTVTVGGHRVAIAALADGQHLVVIRSKPGQAVACASIVASPQVEVPSELLPEGQRQQVMQVNTGAALQMRIFADGFVPNSAEFHLGLNWLTYTAQRAEHLSDGRVRVYYAVSGQWSKASYEERR